MKTTSRPKLVWVVFLFYLLTNAVAVGSLLWLWHASSVSPQALAAIQAISPLGWVFTGLSVALHVSGAFALLALRRSAFTLLFAGLCLGVVQTLLNGIQLFTEAGVLSNLPILISWVIDVSVCLYVRSLRSRGVLT
jgi:hypothetical protein